jgi:diadenylate cyclase
MLHDWSWTVEIAVLTVALYQFWKLFKGTSGARVMTGLVILTLGSSLLAMILNLTFFTALLRYFAGFFALAMVIIFQPELRRFLAELGTRQFTGVKRRQTEVIEAVVNAIEALQQEKLGALIAFERDVIFQPGRETGTMMDAHVSADLLETIFYPRTPLHDGGVMIAGDRIVVAAAIFPVTEMQGLHRTLGLRHRAAIGLAEMTDAVVGVLSEETAMISVAHHPSLERPLSIDQLRARLTELLDR